jgi:hypothetical protein
VYAHCLLQTLRQLSWLEPRHRLSDSKLNEKPCRVRTSAAFVLHILLSIRAYASRISWLWALVEAMLRAIAIETST